MVLWDSLLVAVPRGRCDRSSTRFCTSVVNAFMAKVLPLFCRSWSQGKGTVVPCSARLPLPAGAGEQVL